jgi:protein phosphatase
VSPAGTPSVAGRTSVPARPTSSSAPAIAPATTPDALPSEPAPPVVDPVGCRPVD